MNKDLYLEKTVNVSDPWNWYQENTIKVSMFSMAPEYPNTIRIMFESIDDFMVYMDFEEWEQEANWKWCKQWLWDCIPNTIDCEWLFTHGYRNF